MKRVKIAVDVDEDLHDEFKRTLAQRHGFVKWFVTLSIRAALTTPDVTIEAICNQADDCTYGGCK